jgi:peptidoglycan hydrolase-like protein with peptidoglycan-binding domain
MKVIKAATCSFALGVLFLGLVSMASAADNPAGLDQQDIKKVQQSLSDKGFHPGPVDGVLGSQTRSGIREYQKSESLPVTGRLDKETAGKLGVGPESIGGSFKGAGQEVGKGGQELGHEMKDGKPLAAGKEFGKGIGRAGKKVGQGVKKAVTTDSDRGDREKNTKP